MLRRDREGGVTAASAKPAREYPYKRPINEEKLREKLVYYLYRGKDEMDEDAWFPGNIFDVKLDDEVLGEAQVILVEAQKVEDLTVYDALLTGFKELEELKDAIVDWFGFKGNVEKQGFFKVLYRWL